MSTQYDGSVRINTKIDTRDFNKGTNTINTGLNALGKSLSSLGVKMTSAFSKNSQIKSLEDNFKKATDEVERQAQKVDELKAKLSSLENGDVEIKDKSVTKLQSDFDKATKSADETKSKIDELYMQLDNIQQNAFKNPITQEPVLTGKEQVQFEQMNSQLDTLEAKLETDRNKANELGIALKKAAGLATQNEIAKTKEKLTQAETKLSNLSSKATKAGTKLKNSLNQSLNPLNQMTNGFKKLGTRISRLFAGIFIFNTITKALRSLLNIIKNVAMSNSDFKNSWYQLQASIWVAITPIIDIVIPALQKLVQWIAIAVNAIAKFAITLSGKSYSDIVKRAKALKKQSDAYENLSKSSKKATKSLAAFDEVNTLSDNNGTDKDIGFTGINAENAFNDVSNFDTSSITQKMQELLKVIAGALIVIGVILLFTGHIGWGIGFIIAGAAFFTVSAQATYENDPTQTPKNQLTKFLTYLGTAMLVIGVLLLCFGVALPLSIGLIVAGAATLAAAVALDYDAVKNTIKTFLKDNAGLIAGLSIALLVLGIILCICTGLSPLSVGLIAVGAIGLVSMIALNYNAIRDTITNFFKENAGIITGVSLALLVLGIILLVTGVGIPIGLGLILAGCAGLAGTVSSNWDFITDKIKEVWKKVKLFWSQNIAPVLTKEWWQKLAKNIGNGFIGGIEGMINGVISMFEQMINWIVNGLNKISFDVPDWVPGIGGKTFGFNLSKVNFGRVSIPRLATGAVIPPNREFLAILGDQKRGTNIEAPLDTIKQAVAEVISQINMNNNGFSGTIVVPVTVNGREILRVVREAESELGKQTVYGGFANAY